MAALLALLLLLSVSSADAQSYWDHNGSIVSLEASGASRKFHYQTPRAGLPVSSGTLLFSGRRAGNRYSGTAYVFSKSCGARGYAVEGPVSDDQRSVTMYGRAPKVDSKCRVIGFRDDVLVFNFQDPVEEQRTQVTVTIGKDARGFHFDHEGRTFVVDLDGPYVEHDWFALEDIFSSDVRLKTFVTLGRTSGLRNALAFVSNGRRYIVQDSGYADGHSPENLVLLGHEIGHHICGHQVGLAPKNPWARELEADRVGGVALRLYVKMGLGTERDAIAAAYRVFARVEGTATHPPQTHRIAAIWEGLTTGTSPCFGRTVSLPTDPTPEQEKEAAVEGEKAFCRKLAEGFCEGIRGADNRRRFDFWVTYHNMRATCQRGGMDIPEHVIAGNSISYPGIDCSGPRARLLPQ